LILGWGNSRCVAPFCNQADDDYDTEGAGGDEEVSSWCGAHTVSEFRQSPPARSRIDIQLTSINARR
jgi:hypothetical protein